MKQRIASIFPILAPTAARALRWLEDTKRRRAAHRRSNLAATFIGVTGSSGKSTTSALLTHILAGTGKVQGQHGANVLKPLIRTISRLPADTRFVVAECGIAAPGEMAPMAGLLRPDVAIVTLVALEHKSGFHTVEAVAAEKGNLVSCLAPAGLAILNGDDPLVSAMAAITAARVVTFGNSPSVMYRASEMQAAFPERLTMTVSWPGGSLLLRTRFVGEHFWLPVVAAVTAAIELGVAADIVAKRVATFEPLAATGNVIELANGAALIVDTRKAPWHSMPLALDIVGKATTPRRRLVLGHMSDYTGSNNPKYARTYDAARAITDEVIFVGDHRHRARPSAEDIAEGRFHAFATPREAADHLKATLVPGETILLKGSADLHLERLGLALCEDVQCWAVACGKASSCYYCGRYREPFEWHKGRKRRLSHHFSTLARRLGLRRAPPTAPRKSS